MLIVLNTHQHIRWEIQGHSTLGTKNHTIPQEKRLIHSRPKKMATKSQCVNAIVSLGGSLVDDSTSGHYDVSLIAPPGHHWEDGIHCHAVHWFAGGNKSDFWDEVLDEIHNCLFDPEPCTDDCEYWD